MAGRYWINRGLNNQKFEALEKTNRGLLIFMMTLWTSGLSLSTLYRGIVGSNPTSVAIRGRIQRVAWLSFQGSSSGFKSRLPYQEMSILEYDLSIWT